jgi:hypothetical protein
MIDWKKPIECIGDYSHMKFLRCIDHNYNGLNYSGISRKNNIIILDNNGTEYISMVDNYGYASSQVIQNKKQVLLGYYATLYYKNVLDVLHNRFVNTPICPSRQELDQLIKTHYYNGEVLTIHELKKEI